MRHRIASLAIGIASGTMIVWLGSALESASAQPAVLPADCENGDLVVARAQGRLACERPREALGLSTSCNVGELVVADSFNQLRCQPAKLLPTCSSGESLVSEGSSGWKCAQVSALPSCSSGDSIVAEGSNRWRCVRP